MIDASERALQPVGRFEARLAEVRQRAQCLPRQPRVFFEEWNDPLISGIGWVSERYTAFRMRYLAADFSCGLVFAQTFVDHLARRLSRVAQ